LTKQKDFVTEGLVLGEFGARSNSQKGKVSYRRFVEEGLLREIENPFEQLRWQTVLGDESFVRRLSDKLKSHRAHRREVTGVRRVLRATEPRGLVERVAKHYRIEIKKLLDEPAHGSEARNVAIWLLRQKGALTLREIGVLFGGIDYAAVSQRVRRVDQHMAKHKQFRETCEILNV